MTRLVRNRDGKMVHDSGCRVRGERVPWEWAEAATDDEVQRFIVRLGLLCCKRCSPRGRESEPQPFYEAGEAKFRWKGQS